MTSNAVTGNSNRTKLRVRLRLTHTYNGHIYASPFNALQMWPWTHINIGIERQPAYYVIKFHEIRFRQ